MGNVCQAHTKSIYLPFESARTVIMCGGVRAIFFLLTYTGFMIIEANTQQWRNLDSSRQPLKVYWARGIVPYYISDYGIWSTTDIRYAMDKIEQVSCVLFKELPDNSSHSFTWLHISNPEKTRECPHSLIEKAEGYYQLVLGYDCYRSQIIHALMHALGFNDEVNHPQRDMYIRILWPNIHTKYRPLFVKRKDEPSNLVEYDPMSIMHFHPYAYTINGAPTIAPLIPGLRLPLFDTVRLSPIDIMKLRLTYGQECNKRKVSNLVQTCEAAFKEEDKDPSQDDTEPEKKTDYSQENNSEKTSAKDYEGNQSEKTSKIDSEENKNEIQSGFQEYTDVPEYSNIPPEIVMVSSVEERKKM